MKCKKINYNLCKPFLKYNHYAKRIPNIMKSFGLYENDILIGICTFGMIPSASEYLKWNKLGYKILELNRLFTIDNLPKNSLSKFIGMVFKKLKEEGNYVLISYSDIDQHHNGYIYQATSWLYTGIGSIGNGDAILFNDKKIHGKWKSKYKTQIKEVLKNKGKHRYFKFIGDKRFKKKVTKDFLNMYEILKYPKGKNENYCVSNYSYKSESLDKWFL